jgi:hypothetical protein
MPAAGNPVTVPCMGRWCAGVVALVSLAIGAGCGSDTKEASNGVESNGVESKSPEEVLDVTATALRRVKSFHAESTDGSSPGYVKADVGLPSQLRLSLEERDSSASLLVADGSFYMKGNAAFWKDVDAGRDAVELADRWWKVPFSLAKELTRALDPKTLSRCLVKEHGTLARRGTATIDGRRAVVIVDKGDRPGSVPGRLYVAATGEPLPLRVVTTGKQRPGGHKDPGCDDDTPAEAGDEVIFSNYNRPLEVSPPPAAVDIGRATSR